MKPKHIQSEKHRKSQMRILIYRSQRLEEELVISLKVLDSISISGDSLVQDC